MNRRTPHVLLLLLPLTLWGCGPQTLAEQYLAEMEEIGNVGSTVIHIEESESYALVLGGAADSVDDLEAVSLTPYVRPGDGWAPHAMGGTACGGRAQMLGFEGGYVYCGALPPGDGSTGVSVAGHVATIVELPGGHRVWFVFSDQQAEPEWES